VELAVRDGDNFDGSIEFFVDGVDVGTRFRSSVQGPSGSNTVSWNTPVTSTGFDLTEGTHTITIKDSDGGDQGAGNGTYHIDCIALYDTDYWDSSNFVNTLTPSEKLDGGPPGLYAPTDADFQIDPILRANGGRLEASLSATTNGQALAIAPDTANDPSSLSFNSASNTSALETDFASSFGTWTGRVTLDGVDASTANTAVETSITEYRTERQSLTDLTLKYDSLNSPTVSRPVNDQVQSLVNELADRADLLYEVQWDTSIDDIRIVVAYPGQRTTDADPDLAQYRVEKEPAAEVSAVIVRGRTQQVSAESFTADVNGASLNNDRIQEASERVYDPSTGTEFVRGPNEDYEMDYTNGTISTVAGTSMTNGNTYEIDYLEKARGEANQSGTGGNFVNVVVEEITALTNDSECKEAAEFLLSMNDSPLWTAQVTIPRREAGFELIEEIDPERLPSPDGGGYRLKSIDESPREISLRLGSRTTLGEDIARLRSSIQQTARDV
jgi:hypothetical protein